MTPQPQRIYRTAIVGTGGIAHAHAQATAELPDRARLVACVDVDIDRARAFAAQWNIPAVYTSVEDLLADQNNADQKLDLVHVCTPPGSHVPIAALVMRAGVDVLVEKPPALSLAQLDRLFAVEKETGRHVATVYQHRFGPAAIRLRELIAAGALGRPLLATCNTLWYRGDDYFAAPWRGNWDIEGGGPTMGHGIHQFDLLLSVLGPWAELTAVAARQSRPTDTEDVSAAIVTFESGAVATIVNSLVSPRETSQLRFDFENATVELEHLYGYTHADWRITPLAGQEPSQEAGQESLVQKWNDGFGSGTPAGDAISSHRGQFVAIFDALDRGEAPPTTSTESRVTMELVAAIYASAFTGTRVRSGEIEAGHPFYESMLGSGAPWMEAAR